MHIISAVKRFISSLPKNRIFTTREVLPLGSRGAVDQALRRLVQAEIIVRLARGVFIRAGSNRPTAYEVATAKYHAFGKQIAKHGSELAIKLGLIDKNKQQVIFTTTSRSSQFWFGNILIKIKGICHRKMKLNESKIGERMAALWYMGKTLCQQSLFLKAIKGFGRQEHQQMRLYSPLVPAWLDRFFTKRGYPHFMFA